MTIRILLFQELLISVALAGCIHRAPTLKMLNDRSEYEDNTPYSAELKLSGNDAMVPLSDGIPARTKPEVAHIWIYPHDMGKEGYFWGGWLSVVTSEDKWTFINPPKDPAPKEPQKKGKPKKKEKTADAAKEQK